MNDIKNGKSSGISNREKKLEELKKSFRKEKMKSHGIANSIVDENIEKENAKLESEYNFSKLMENLRKSADESNIIEVNKEELEKVNEMNSIKNKNKEFKSDIDFGDSNKNTNMKNKNSETNNGAYIENSNMSNNNNNANSGNNTILNKKEGNGSMFDGMIKYGKKILTGALIATAILVPTLGSISQANAANLNTTNITSSYNYTEQADFDSFMNSFGKETELPYQGKIDVGSEMNIKFDSRVNSLGKYQSTAIKKSVKELAHELLNTYFDSNKARQLKGRSKAAYFHNCVLKLTLSFHINEKQALKHGTNLANEAKGYLYAMEILENYAYKNNIQSFKDKLAFVSRNELFRYKQVKRAAELGKLKTPFAYENNKTVGKSSSRGGNTETVLNSAPNQEVGHDNTNGVKHITSGSSVNYSKLVNARAFNWLNTHNKMYRNINELKVDLKKSYGENSSEYRKVIDMIERGQFEGYEWNANGNDGGQLKGKIAGGDSTTAYHYDGGTAKEYFRGKDIEYKSSVIDYVKSGKRMGKSNEWILKKASKSYGKNSQMYKDIKYYMETGKTDFR